MLKCSINRFLNGWKIKIATYQTAPRNFEWAESHGYQFLVVSKFLAAITSYLVLPISMHREGFCFLLVIKVTARILYKHHHNLMN